MERDPAAPRRLYLMQTAHRPQDGRPVVCYLVQTGTGENVLIDSGLPATFQVPPGMEPPIMGKTVVEQLAEIGLTPDDIDLLVCTHFDIDHAGRLAEFPRTTLVVQRAHYTAAQGGQPRFAPTRPQWDHEAAHYRLLDGDSELLPGLELIETSGHCTGHQSVLVHLPHTGPVLLTIDAVMQASDFTVEHSASSADEDEVALRRSTVKLLDQVERDGVALVVFGHDGPQWQALRKLPEYYE
jgi:N-acyl homoserine lactone hydrolase